MFECRSIEIIISDRYIEPADLVESYINLLLPGYQVGKKSAKGKLKKMSRRISIGTQ